ncbi:MAG TPA: hypothetical protein VNI20_01680 [Fimbriimonadaceae bacterium]|nr:hypothetical protein [Fimbriimonadaceae bacterium]
MGRRTVILLLCAFAVLGAASCGAVKESADEGQNALQAGMRSKKAAQDIKVKKEAYDSQGDDF